MSLFCVLCNQELILFTSILHTCIYAFCLVFQEKYKLIQLNCYLHLQLIVVMIEFVVMSMLFVKGFFFVNFDLLVMFCHRLPNGEFVRF